MSGYVHPPAELLEEFDSTKWNPLQCNICSEQYQDPCILQCYHSFCARCVQHKVENGKLACPICGCVTVIKEGSTLPPPDPLLKFLVESSAGDSVQCANCEKTSGEMFYCKTCSQPLCVQCREETHRARMFDSHHVVLHTKHTRDSQKDCKVHGEPYILFSTEKKVMLCINCFRDMKVESRSHCVDLETAYKQGCQKIADTMQSIRDLQCSVRDGILLLRALLEEIETNAETERQSISQLYDAIQERIADTKQALLQEVERQYQEKDALFKNQLVSLRTFLPVLHVHLVTCASFCSSTSKYEFLDFTYEMMRRLTAIIQVQQPLHPSQTSDIVTEYKTKLAQCLEPLLFPHRNGSSLNIPASMATSVAAVTRFETSPTITTTASMRDASTSRHGDADQQYSQKKKQLKLKLMENKGFFADHCKEFDDSHRELMTVTNKLKQSVQELQKDITLRRSLTREITVNELKTNITETEVNLEQHLSHVEGKQPALEKHWEESLEMIAAEQEVYQAQLQDVCRLKTEISSVKTILQKLTSFMSSIASVTQRLAPKLGQASSVAEHECQHAALLQTINTIEPDSQQRVAALKTAEEERDFKVANRSNPMDEALIKTKGLLRAPSARKESTIKRHSSEIKDSKEDGASGSKKADATVAAASIDNIKRLSSEIKEFGLKDGLVTLSSEKCLLPSSADAGGTSITMAANGFIPESPSKSSDSSFNDSSSESPGSGSSPKSSETRFRKKSNTQSANVADGAAYDTHIDCNVKLSFDTEGEKKLLVCVSEADSTDDVSSTVVSMMPDIAAEAVRSERENSPQSAVSTQSTPDNDDSSSFSIVTSDSEQDSTLESPQSLEESLKPGHVKDLIKRVSSIGKGDTTEDQSRVKVSGEEHSRVKVSGEEHSRAKGTGEEYSRVKVSGEDICRTKVSVSEDSGVEYDRVNQFVSLEKADQINGNLSQADALSTSPKSLRDDSQASGDSDDVYVAKSLPELAQVFEPGELKQKKRKGKSDPEKQDKGK